MRTEYLDLKHRIQFVLEGDSLAKMPKLSRVKLLEKIIEFCLSEIVRIKKEN